MKTYPIYECELCGHTSRDQAEVATCEAVGTPPLPDWAKSRVGQRVRGFGEGGVKWGTLRALELRRAVYGVHAWFAVGDFWLSHNQSEDEDGVPLAALDPLHGWDFLRYADDIDADIREWVVCCAEYGIEPDLTQTSWFENRGSVCQQMVLDAVAKCQKNGAL